MCILYIYTPFDNIHYSGAKNKLHNSRMHSRKLHWTINCLMCLQQLTNSHSRTVVLIIYAKTLAWISLFHQFSLIGQGIAKATSIRNPCGAIAPPRLKCLIEKFLCVYLIVLSLLIVLIAVLLVGLWSHSDHIFWSLWRLSITTRFLLHKFAGVLVAACLAALLLWYV